AGSLANRQCPRKAVGAWERPGPSSADGKLDRRRRVGAPAVERKPGARWVTVPPPACHMIEDPMSQPEASKRPPPRRGAIVGLALIAALILAGLILSHLLGRAARLQDCVLSGRSDCVAPDASGRRN